MIEWLNMLQDNGLEPATWVQAALLAELAGQDLDIGGVYVPPTKKKPHSTRLFGDDTAHKEASPAYGWNVRGLGGAFIPGSVYTINVTRPIVLFAIDDCLSGRLMMSKYLRAILRKRIRRLLQPPNELPKVQDIEDVFILYEGFFPKFNPRNSVPGKKPSQKSRISPSRPTSAEAGLAQTPQTRSIAQDEEGAKEDNGGNVEITKNPLLAYIN